MLDDEVTKCPGCGRLETHKMCPAWGTPFYMSGVDFTEDVEFHYNLAVESKVVTKDEFFRTIQIKRSDGYQFFLEEAAVRDAIPDGREYYQHIIDNIELDRSNPKNSYFMYIAGKVDNLDLSRPCSFTSAATALPDIDVDFPTDYREKAIDYVKNKYGKEKVCQISTYGRLAGRSAIKAVMRTEGIYDFETMNEVTGGIPDEAAISDKMEESGEESVIMWVLENPEAAARMKGKFTPTSEFCRLEGEELVGDYADVFRKAIALEGTFQNKGKHAAGVIISSEVLHESIPMCRAKDGSIIAADDMGTLEKKGQVKFDFLGVDILNKIQEAWGTDIVNVPLDDPATWKIICDGNTKGCFQIESHLGKEWSEKVAPHNIEELAAIISIIRPGTLLAKAEDGRSMTKVYADRKNGIEPVLDTPINRVIDTYGVLIYQETLLKITKQLANFTSAASLDMMKSVGKKNAKKLFSLEEKFLSGCKKVGLITEKEASDLFTTIKASARYAFNKSHAISYAFPAYWSAYVKAHAPLKFYETWLKYSSHKLDPHEEVRHLVLSARMDNIEILPPSCKYLTEGFFIKGNSVVFGLSHIKGVSSVELEKLFDKMKTHGIMSDIVTYMTQILPYVNKRTVEALINCGCFSFLGYTRSNLIHLYECFKDLTDKEMSFFESNQFQSPEEALVAAAKLKKEGGACSTKARVPKILMILERLKNPGRPLHDLPSKIAASEENHIGITLSCSYMDSCLSTGIADTTCREIKRGKPGKNIVVVRVKEVKEHLLKSDKKMAFLTVEDESAEIDNIVCFADQYAMFNRLLFEGAFVSIFGQLGQKGSFVIDRVVEL